MVRGLVGIAGALALVAVPAGGSADAGCGDPARSVPLVSAVTAAGVVKAEAGVVVSAAGQVLTEWHWLKDARRVLLTLPGRAPIPARPLGISEAHDLVLLEPASPVSACPVSFGDVSRISVSQPVRVYGYPFAGFPRSEFVAVETGTITAIEGAPVRAFQSDVVITQGFAGGPVVDMGGKVIGILTIVAHGVVRGAQASSARGLPGLIDQLRRESSVARPAEVAPPPGSPARRASGPRQVAIAVHVSLSGPSAAVGRSILDGAAQAVADMTAAFEAHGFHLRLVPLDDQGQSSTAVANARTRLIQNSSVLFVIGHDTSGVCWDAVQVYETAALPMVTPACEVSTFTDSGVRTFFRVIGRDDMQGAVAARFASSSLRARTAYVVYEAAGQYGLRTAAAFWWEAKRLRMRTAGLTPVDPAGLEAVSAAAVRANPDVLYYGGGADGAARFLKAARARGARFAFVGPDALDSSEFAYFAGAAAADVFYTILDGPPRFYPDAGPFAARFRALLGREPGPFAGLAYDAVGIGLEAVTRASMGYRRMPTRDDVLAALRDPGFAFRGVTGTIRFTANGDRLEAPVFVMQVRGPTWARWPDNRLVATMIQ